MLNPDKIKQDAIEYVNRYIFDNVFNQPNAEFRSNIRLIQLSKKPQINMYYGKYKQLVLPLVGTSRKFYYLFTCSAGNLQGLIPFQNEWIRSDNLNNTYDVSLDVYSKYGIMIPKSAVYIKPINNYQKEVIIAISSDILISLINKEDFDQIYLTIISLMLFNNKRKVYSHISNINNEFNTIKNIIINNNTVKNEIYINGYNYNREIVRTMFLNNQITLLDKIDLYVDDNTINECSIELIDRKIYTSSTEYLNKDIIHIPKEINENQNIITYNQMKIFIRDNENKGVFLSYISGKSVSQLTFQDISITSALIDTLNQYLNNKAITIYMKLYKYGNERIFISNGDCVEKLYKYQDDEKIKQHLHNEISSDLTVWSADQLEQSRFVYDMFYSVVLNYLNSDFDLIKHNIKSLGYYRYMSLISYHMIEITNKTHNDSFSILKPIVWKNINLSAIVFLNGKKINDNNIEITNNDETFGFIIHNTIVRTTDIIFVKFYPDFQNSVYTFMPVYENHDIIIKKQDYVFYIKEPPSGYIQIQEFNGTITNFGYKKVENINDLYYIVIDNGDDTNTIRFTAYSYNFFFYIQPKYFSDHKEITNVVIDDQHSLIYNLTTLDQANIETIPVLDIRNIEVYLNGYYMIKDIDYKLKKLESDNKLRFIGYQLIINNVAFLNNNNDIDIYYSNMEIEEQNVGYIVDNKILYNNAEELWYYGLSYLIVNGKIISFNDIEKVGDYLEFKNMTINNGTPCTIKTTIQKEIKEMFCEYEDPEYFTNLDKINNYLFGNPPAIDPDTIIVPYTWKIYSIYLNEIIRKILNGELNNLDFSVNTNQLIGQLTQFDYLKTFDLLFDDETNIDRRFVDFYPSYIKDLEINDMEKYMAIKRLIVYYLNYNDQIHDTDVVYTE